MLKRFTLLSVFVLLSACTVSASPGGTNGGIINETLGLRQFPGSSDVEVTRDGDDTTVRFSSDASLQEVYDYFHGELTALGWERTELDTSTDEIEADYVRDSRELELELERTDDRYKLELDVDGDNPNVGREGGTNHHDDPDDDDDDD